MYQVPVHEDLLQQSPSGFASVAAAPRDPAPSGCCVANTFADVLASWRLVYRVYRQSGLIDDNPWSIHTCPQMVSSRAAVVQRHERGRLHATISAVADGPHGLPLDTVYRRELDVLRSENRRLIEVGQFAHDYERRAADSDPGAGDPGNPGAGAPAASGAQDACLARQSLMELTAYTFQFGVSLGATDFVIGVHPRHSRYYTRSWGLEPFAATRTYPTVNHRPVVILGGNWRELLARPCPPPCLRQALRNPRPAEFFAQRCDFKAEEMERSGVPVGEYLRHRYGPQIAAA
jgi:hypothetical protein